MKFLVDAHLPTAVCRSLADRGHDAVHTRDLPVGNATSDERINDVSVADQRVVISKDTDFFYSHVLSGRPWKLLLVRTGNMRTAELCDLLSRHWPDIESALATHTLVEIDRQSVTPID